jgi:MFS family permease
VPLRIFRPGHVRGANVAMTLMAAAMVGLFFVLVLYTQQQLGWSALKSGLSQLPMGLVLMTVAGIAGPLTGRVGAKPVLVGGLALFTAGLAWYSQIPAHGSYLTDLLGPSIVVAVGLGLAFVALTVASVGGVEDQHLGLASGLINATQQIGGAIGLAVVTAVVDSHTHAAGSSVAAINDGFHAALLATAAIAACATVLAAVLLPGRKQSVTPTAPAAAPAV